MVTTLNGKSLDSSFQDLTTLIANLINDQTKGDPRRRTMIGILKEKLAWVKALQKQDSEQPKADDQLKEVIELIKTQLSDKSSNRDGWHLGTAIAFGDGGLIVQAYIRLIEELYQTPGVKEGDVLKILNFTDQNYNNLGHHISQHQSSEVLSEYLSLIQKIIDKTTDDNVRQSALNLLIKKNNSGLTCAHQTAYQHQQHNNDTIMNNLFDLIDRFKEEGTITPQEDQVLTIDKTLFDHLFNFNVDYERSDGQKENWTLGHLIAERHPQAMQRYLNFLVHIKNSDRITNESINALLKAENNDQLDLISIIANHRDIPAENIYIICQNFKLEDVDFQRLAGSSSRKKDLLNYIYSLDEKDRFDSLRAAYGSYHNADSEIQALLKHSDAHRGQNYNDKNPLYLFFANQTGWLATSKNSGTLGEIREALKKSFPTQQLSDEVGEENERVQTVSSAERESLQKALKENGIFSSISSNSSHTVKPDIDQKECQTGTIGANSHENEEEEEEKAAHFTQ